jgi:peptidoglycan/LPS O-acetylase OafA/YrhL
MRAAVPPVDFAARIPELDGIRGIAIAAVLVHHYFLLPIRAPLASFPSYIQAAGRLAWSGVDLFFVLSGFLIGGILLDAQASTNYFRVFYTRRFLRIVPIYLVCLAAGLALSVVIDHGLAPRLSWMLKDRITLKPYFVFLQNFWMARRATFGMVGLTVTWSLAIEEQFYLTLPLVIRFCRSHALLLTAILAGVVIAPVSRLVLYVLYPAHAIAGVVLMPCRADALLLGVLGAIAVREPHWRDWLERRRRLMLVFLTAMAGGLVALTKYSANPYGLGMLGFGFTYLAIFYLLTILYAVLFRDSRLGGLLRWRWLRWLGSIAFGVYLFHELIRTVFFGLIWSRPPAGMASPEFSVTLVALGVTLALCRLSWKLFEKPLIDIGHRVHYEESCKAAESAFAA